MSTYYAAECGYLGWSQVENVQDKVVPQVLNYEYEDIIYSTTEVLRGVDSLSQNCIETGYDYYSASLNYGKAIQDEQYLLLNLLYHTEKLYESTNVILDQLDLSF